MDSGIGALNLLAEDRRPLLISHAYRGDSEKQIMVRDHLPVEVSRFAAVANPVSLTGRKTDVQMRTRSFNFLAYGALVGATLAQLRVTGTPVELFVPENGLIALNPPMTARRIGALSTRTTHPHFWAYSKNPGYGRPACTSRESVRASDEGRDAFWVLRSSELEGPGIGNGIVW